MEFNKHYAKKTATMFAVAGAALLYSGAKSDLADAIIADPNFKSARALTSQAFTLESTVRSNLNERKFDTDVDAVNYQPGLGDKIKATLDEVDNLHKHAYEIMPAKKFAEKTDAYVGAQTLSGFAALVALGAGALGAFNGYRTLTRKETGYTRR